VSKPCIGRQQRGCKQSENSGAAASVMASLVLEQREYLSGSSHHGLPNFLQSLKCSRTRRRRGSTSQFDDDQRMAQDLIRLQQCLKHRIGDSKMCDPDRCIGRTEFTGGDLSPAAGAGCSSSQALCRLTQPAAWPLALGRKPSSLHERGRPYPCRDHQLSKSSPVCCAPLQL
jgi:hypothetical protein